MQNLKVTEANRRRGLGNREKVNSKRINLECNTYVQDSNVRNLPVLLSLSQLAKPLVLLINAYSLSSTKLEIRAKQFLPEAREWGGGEGWGGRDGVGGSGEK
jgi:hypothetical protein